MTSYRAAAAFAAISSLLLVWLSAGVGIIGKDGDPANGLNLGVLAVGLVGACVSRLRAAGLASTMLAMAIAQTIVAAVALTLGLGRPFSGPAELLLLNAFFVAAFGASAWLFRRAARAAH